MLSCVYWNARTAEHCCIHSLSFLLSLSFFRLLSIVAGYCWIAEFFLHSFLDYSLTPGKEKKKKKKKEAIFYIISSPSGSGESLIHTGLLSMSLALLWPSLALGFVQPSFLNFFVLFLLPNSAHLLFTSIPSNFYILKNASCRKKTSSLLQTSSTWHVIFNSLTVLV